MKITKPKENQLLFEDENLKKFTLKSSKMKQD